MFERRGDGARGLEAKHAAKNDVAEIKASALRPNRTFDQTEAITKSFSYQSIRSS
jgi:hypothetical protein